MTDAEPLVLSERRRNRILLARQLLLERSALPIPDALEQMCGIQNQYAPNAYLRLWSCLRDFRRDDLTRAYEDGSVVQGTLMRGTIHTVSALDYRRFAAAIRDPMRQWARRIHRDEGADRASLVRRVRAALRGRTLSAREVDGLTAEATRAASQTIDVDAELLRVPPSGTWERRRADRYALAADVLPSTARRAATRPLEHLIVRYLGGFGPAAAADIASFTGVPVTTLRQALRRITIREFRDSAGKPLLDVPEAPLPDEDVEARVRFLPTWDAALLVHARGTGVLPEEYRPRIFHTRMPPSYPTFLVDGRVAGTWRYEPDAERVTLSPFGRLARGVRQQLDDEAERLAAFHAVRAHG